MPQRIWYNIIRPILSERETRAAAYLDDHVIRRKFVLSQMSKHIGKDKFEPAPLLGLTVLDIGCGELGMSEALTLRGAEVTAIDIDPELLDKAKARAEQFGTKVEFAKARPEDLIVKGSSKYDLVLALDVLSVAQDPQKTAWAIQQLIKPNGLLVFSDWQPSWLERIHMKLLGLRVPAGNLPLKKLKDLFRNAGLEPQEIVGLRFDQIELEWNKSKHSSSRYIGVAKLRK